MTFLPVVERELRVAARKRSTFWVRMIAALIAFAIGVGFMCVAESTPFAMAPATLGRGLFQTLSWISFGAVLSAGLFLTSDCLSEEKREGTIGLLFLTDLRGYDVVMGKLLSTSLRGVCALLAIFPVLAIPLLMGGVTGAQFWETVISLINALFISLAAGLFVSAISRDSQKAMAATLLLLSLLAGGGPMIDAAMSAYTGGGRMSPIFSNFSPVHLFESTAVRVWPPFWVGLLANQVIGWTLFVLTCQLLPRTWQESKIESTKSPDRLKPGLQTRAWWRFDLIKRRPPLDRKLLEPNPAVWLALHESWSAIAIWGATFLLAIGVLIAHMAFMGWWGAAAPFTLFLYLGIASQSGRLFVESRRSGFIELLLSTPLSGREIVQGQWRALLRMFGPALALFLVLHVVGSFLAQQATWKVMGARTVARRAVPPTTIATTSVTVVGTSTVAITSSGGTVTTIPGGGFAMPPAYVTMAMAFIVTLTMAANLVALAWFGMWMGLNSKNGSLATLKTIIFVQVIPWFVISFASIMMVPLFLMRRMFMGTGAMSSQFMVWYPLLTTALATVLYLAKDLVFTLWARRKLYSEFRECAVRSVALTPLPLPLPVPAPPIIAPP